KADRTVGQAIGRVVSTSRVKSHGRCQRADVREVLRRGWTSRVASDGARRHTRCGVGAFVRRARTNAPGRPSQGHGESSVTWHPWNRRFSQSGMAGPIWCRERRSSRRIGTGAHDARVLSGNWGWHESGGFRNGGALWRGGDRRLSCPAVRPPKPAAPFQFLVLLMAGWIHRRQQLAIAYLQAENRVLRERLGTGRLRFTDADRRLLAEKGQGLGRTMLAEVAKGELQVVDP